ncbi:hypothetical protein GCM10011512_10410 [Tersicoccus solisilvae]|uniref:Major facilitator superfamily (MFS) profile domain-containing protein n=1 Tax=Tersicoccus solisilvae TaxID=1882339 RepID=A0ABQ1NUN9_9MICC|nr:hypothetical protein [Tersicoccus solisilvae]GGC85472.1 hypothetical protein GCM10011512_10410 [Tersicoccus solisilvae]
MRIVGVVAGTNVMRGLPGDRTTIGAALVDTASEVATAVGIAVSGTILAALIGGDVTAPGRTAGQAARLVDALGWAGAALTLVSAALVGWGLTRARGAGD